jgi:hypothetical protein
LLIIQFVGILMALKRLSSNWEDGDGSEVPRQGSKRRLTLACGVTDVLKGLALQEFVIKLEPLLRKVVREELDRKLPFSHPSPTSSLSQLEPSHARNLQLHFVGKLPPTLFTGNKIESEHNQAVKIVIIDAFSKELVTSLPLPSIKVEIVVLDGDFGPDDQEDWTEQEFNAKVVRQREGKRPLVTGECVVTLKGGAGYIRDVGFTDNSKWMKSGKFRLGARAVPTNSTELRIREAKSKAFVVKDRRGEAYQKHSRPNLSDEIWRLTKIAKDGKFHERLASKGIETVKDFLRFYYVDRSSLRNILGAGGGVSNKTWKTITEHATACVLDKQYYMYSRDAGMVGLVLNSVCEVVGAVFEGQNYEMDKLNPLQKGLVENLKRHAYENLGDLVPIDEPPVFGPGVVPASLQPVNFGDLFPIDEAPVFGPGMVPASLQSVNLPGVHQAYSFSDQQNLQLASNHVETSLPYLYEQQDQFQLEVSVEQHSHPMQFFPPTSTHNLMSMDSHSAPYGEGNSWAPGGSLGPLMQIGNQTADDSFQIDGLFFAPSNEAVGKRKLRWCMIRAVMKWRIVRRDVAAKKWQDFLEFQDY